MPTKTQLAAKQKRQNSAKMPTGKAWDALESFDTLILKDGENDDSEPYEISVLDNVAVVGEDTEDKLPTMQPWEYWICQICEIRGTPGTEDSWVKVKWFYTGHDLEVTGNIPGFDGTWCGRYERIFSHHSDIISAASISHPVDIRKYLEDDPAQAVIPPNAFYVRHFYEVDTDPAVVQYTKTATPKPTRASASVSILTCELCEEPYNPDDAGAESVQHFCPNSTCRRGYHRGCLAQLNARRVAKSPATLVRARLANVECDAISTHADGNLDAIPPDLILLAAQPLVRGGEHGVVGNLGTVMHARRTVHAALSNEGDGLYGWEEDPAFADWEEAPDGGEKSFSPSENVVVLTNGGDCDIDRLLENKHEFWVARILEIRGSLKRGVWVKVNWYYSPQDLQEQIPSFDPAGCSPFERIYSEHGEIISALTIYGHAVVHKFNESDPNQSPIRLPSSLSDSFDFFCRYYFDVGQWVVLHMHPQGTGNYYSIVRTLCGVCSRRYNPGAMQRWCPASGCRRGYHVACLQSDSIQECANPGPGTQVEEIQAEHEELVRARLGNTPDSDAERVVIPPVSALVATPTSIPRLLVLLAAQPIVRGGTHGVAGNVAAVVKARRMVREALSASGGRKELDHWEDEPGFEMWDDAIVEGFDVNGLRFENMGQKPLASSFHCPSCMRAI
ncbi:hypothetical protein MKEN_00267700 [Mycena kentingensis (nom. inval.)]|nr:hypothetical protein MKEN_00267700 [Mycena kentingensis (nom. inval.)]